MTGLTVVNPNSPIIVSDNQHDMFSETPEVLSLVVHIHGIMWCLKHQSLPVVYLLEHLQQLSEK